MTDIEERIVYNNCVISRDRSKANVMIYILTSFYKIIKNLFFFVTILTIFKMKLNFDFEDW